MTVTRAVNISRIMFIVKNDRTVYVFQVRLVLIWQSIGYMEKFSREHSNKLYTNTNSTQKPALSFVTTICSFHHDSISEILRF